MRLRRIIAAFLREEASNLRQRKILEKAQLKEGDKLERQRQRETKLAERQRSRGTGAVHRWHKRNKADFLRTVLSFGVETTPGNPDIQWDRFRELSGLENRSDSVLNAYYQRFVAACEEIMKQQKPTALAAATTADSPAHQAVSGGGNNETPIMSRESSLEPSSTTAQEGREESTEQDDAELDLVPYDKARRSLKRIAQMKRLRESVMVHPDFEANLMNARKTSGLPR
jgi:hypothetical protein